MAIIDDIIAIRERWHTKRHPFFQAFAEGKLPLRAMGVYKAMHWHFVQRAVASFGIVYARNFALADGGAAVSYQLSARGGGHRINNPFSGGNVCVGATGANIAIDVYAHYKKTS